jgi:uncharacterized protein involved in exopolysaccharide biosynthesis
VSEHTPDGLQLGRPLLVRSALAAVIAGLLVGLVSLVLPKSYRAQVRILPSLGGARSALQSLAGGSDISSFLEVAGARQENPVQTFPEILLGRVVLSRTLGLQYPPWDSATSHTVLAALRVSGTSAREQVDSGVQRLRKLITVEANPRTSMISVAVETPDSVFSAFLANSLISELGRFNVDVRRSQGGAVREFVARRVDEAKRELNQAENALTSFRQSNLRIGNSPQLNLEEDRLKRDLDIRADTYRLLARQYEIARIEEHRDTPTFTIVEPAIPPFRKHRPRVLLNAAIGATIALIMSLFWVLAARRLAPGGGGAHPAGRSSSP